MKTVEGEFEHLYFHDSVIKNILFIAAEIIVELSFAHILGQHSQNTLRKVTFVKDCQLIFSKVSESVIKLYVDEQKELYVDEQKEWIRSESPKQTDLLQDIVNTELINPGHYKLSGMTIGSQWSEWCIKAEKVELKWETEGDSWLTNLTPGS